MPDPGCPSGDRAGREILLRIANDVAEGRPVDWDRILEDADPDLEAHLQGLRELAHLADAFRETLTKVLESSDPQRTSHRRPRAAPGSDSPPPSTG
ncbi:MAG: hypothetical protein R3E12_13615 [Candidatus Eisenbacteria bacterium]|uniref:Uncharacterized protein n=1 Tax=Eiseniibacteriota bacterium TaxID=2212470 RepID=A0A956RP71_UNCEI|nr:hypothetical protein [Candidatus Eisenbacteria bacterium]